MSFIKLIYENKNYSLAFKHEFITGNNILI